MTTPEEVYRTWHRETNAARGIRVRSVKNFEKAQAKPEWKFFEKCAAMINRTAGHIDVDLYVRSLAIHFEGWFNPNILSSPRSIRIYKDHTNKLKDKGTPQKIYEEVVRSVRFVAAYCAENGIKDLDGYLVDGMYMIPTVMKHFSAASISPYFLASIDGFCPEMLSSYPSDTTKEYMSTFMEDHHVYRTRLMANDRTRKMSKNLEMVIQRAILQLN